MKPDYKISAVNPFRKSKGYVEEQARKNNEIIYGARAFQKQSGPVSLLRHTDDYDVMTEGDYEKSAQQLAKTLNKKTDSSSYYTKPALHPGTEKVMHVGIDKIKGTKDDRNVADYSKYDGRETVNIDGIRYESINSMKDIKKKTLKDKSSAYRHKKDEKDLALIKSAEKIKKVKFF